MSILIIGANGMLARALRNQLTADGLVHEGVDLPDFDITNPEQVETTIKLSHTAVLNCSAYTNVDAAETDEATAEEISQLLYHAQVMMIAKGLSLADVEKYL